MCQGREDMAFYGPMFDKKQIFTWIQLVPEWCSVQKQIFTCIQLAPEWCSVHKQIFTCIQLAPEWCSVHKQIFTCIQLAPEWCSVHKLVPCTMPVNNVRGMPDVQENWGCGWSISHTKLPWEKYICVSNVNSEWEIGW